MRILVLGSSGMLGHKLVQLFSKSHDVIATARTVHPYDQLGLGNVEFVKYRHGSENEEPLESIILRKKPDWVVNCIGVIKQLQAASDPLVAIPVNSLLPHQINQICGRYGARMIHISTDCVFNGKCFGLRPYMEDDPLDAEDLYGRSKALGEVSSPPGITLRTSIIGRELKGRSGLVEWFLSQAGKEIKGFTNAMYTGFTTIEMARIMETVMRKDLSPGLYQVSSEPINKYDLLCLAKKRFGMNVKINPDDKLICDRRLDSSRFRNLTGFQPKAWEEMIDEMADDPSPYEEWRRTCCSTDNQS